MSSEVRTFVIPDDQPDEAQTAVAAFLRSVVVDRIDTAYADGAWRMLVLYQDARRKEESAQIQSAIMAALNSWRDQESRRSGLPREVVLSDELVNEIGHYAPTTERELSSIASAQGVDLRGNGSAVVQVVKATLDALID